MSLNDIIQEFTDLLKAGGIVFDDFKDGDNVVDLAPVGQELTELLRDRFNVPIPNGFEIQSLKFKQK